MGILRRTGKVVTSVINVRVDHWLGLEYIKYSIGQITNTIKGLFVTEHAEQEENFEESLQRLNLTEQDLKAREKEFTKLLAIHLLLAIITFTYSLYLFVSGNWGGGIMALCITLYPIALAFRFHFWLFQIKNRKLGSSLQDWWNSK